MPLLTIVNLETSDLVIGDAKKSFPQITVDASDTREVAVTGSDLEKMGPVLDRLVDAGSCTFTVAEDPDVSDKTELVAPSALLVKRTVTVGHADLTAAVNGTAQAVNIGDALPANARIVSTDMHTLTPFTGGGASAVGVDVGTSGDVDAIVDGADVFAAAVDGGPATMPPGIRPNKLFATAGAQLIATFTPDGAHTLLALDAGAVTIDVFFTVQG